MSIEIPREVCYASDEELDNGMESELTRPGEGSIIPEIVSGGLGGCGDEVCPDQEEAQQWLP